MASAEKFKELTGKSLFNLDVGGLTNNPSEMTALFYAGLLDSGLSKEDIAGMVEIKDLAAVFGVITEELSGNKKPDPLPQSGSSAS